MMMTKLRASAGLSSVRGASSIPATARGPIQRAVRATVEHLEDRVLLSVTINNHGVVSVTGTQGNDSIGIITEPSGHETDLEITVNGQTTAYDEADVHSIYVNTLNGNDTVAGAGVSDELKGIGLYINAGNGDDVLIGSASYVQIHAGDGNDTLIGGAGKNRLYAGNGNDVLVAGHSGDLLLAGTGTDDFYTLGSRTRVVNFIPGDKILTGTAIVDTGSVDPNSSLVAQVKRKKKTKVVVPVDNVHPIRNQLAPLNLPTGITPQQMAAAYGINLLQKTNLQYPTYTADGAGQTIMIVDVGGDPTLQADLTFFDQTYGLPDPTLTVAYVTGQQSNFINPGDISETALDVEWAHALAPAAAIDVEFAATEDPNDLAAAMRMGAQTLEGTGGTSTTVAGGVESISFGYPENSPFFPPLYPIFDAVTSDKAFTQVSFLASAGDTAPLVNDPLDPSSPDYPALDPHVTAVGGTTLNIDPNTGLRTSEQVWGTYPDGSGGGGGESSVVPIPGYQQGLTVSGGYTNTGASIENPIGIFRDNPDISMDANPNTGVAVFDTSGELNGFGEVGGTSLSSPMFAAVVTLANQLRNVADSHFSALHVPIGSALNADLYNLYRIDPSAYFHDITQPQPGLPSPEPVGVGYDLATGVGTPIANTLVPALAGFINDQGFSMGIHFVQSITTSPPPLNNGDAVVNFFGVGSFNGKGLRADLDLFPLYSDGSDASDYANIVLNEPLKIGGPNDSVLNGNGVAYVQIDGNDFAFNIHVEGKITVVKHVDHVTGNFYTVDPVTGQKVDQGPDNMIYGNFSD